MYKYLPRPASGRTRLVAGAAPVVVFLLVGFVTVACSDQLDSEVSAPGHSASPTDTAGGDGDGAASGSLGSSGDGTGGEPGDGGADPGGGPEPVDPAPKDCVTYDPALLTVEALGEAWRLRSGSHAMKVFDTKAEAEDGLKVARNWSSLCFIGRGNDKADRYRFIINYWEEPSGLPFGPAPAFDCTSYDPDDLEVSPALTGDSWVVRDGGLVVAALATEADAERARVVASEFSQRCFIGADNTREDRYRYIMDYWRS